MIFFGKMLILKITKPIYLMIKFCDGEGPKMGEIYERMDNMLGAIKEAVVRSKFHDSFYQLEDIVLKRWEKMTIPLHCLGFALNPRFYVRSVPYTIFWRQNISLL